MPRRAAGRRRRSTVEVDPRESARDAGLRYSSDKRPGISREPDGRGGFRYRDADGALLRSATEVQRIRHLAIPPAWTDVWICPAANGHLQATGRDARGRKQYRYHERWREVRDATKYQRMVAFGEALPGIRARVSADLARRGLVRERVLATLVRLLDTTFIRVGNEEYAQENRSYGLTTLRDRHVEVQGATLRFEFRGKAGKVHNVAVADRRVAAVVKRLQTLPGQELFQWVDADGVRHAVDSGDVNTYLGEVSGDHFTAKDFRTWAGTVLAAWALISLGEAVSQAQAKRNVVEAVKQVAHSLGNTPAVCRRCYVHPAVIDAHLDGSLPQALQGPALEGLTTPRDDLSEQEAAVLTFLRRRGRAEAATAAA